MIKVHRLKGDEFYINHRLIESIEQTPDTVLRLTTDKKYVVKESPEEIVRLIRNFDREIFGLTHPGNVDTLE
jgi:flagellar protein FlbD